MNILNFIIESSICLVIFTTFYKILLSKSKYFILNRFYLLASLFLSLIIPFINISFDTVSANYIAFIEEITINGVSNAPAKNSKGISGLNYNSLVTIIYFSGAIILLARFIIQLLSLRKQLNKLPVQPRSNSLRIIETKKNISHYSFFRTIVLGSYSNKNEKQHIIAHELGHIKNWHSLDKIFVEIIISIFWFNPFVWVLKNELYLTHEYQADASTIDSTGKVSYMKTLMNLASINQSNSLINNFNQSFIKRRFKMISNEKVPKAKFAKFLLTVLFILGVGFIFACSTKSEELQIKTLEKETISEPTETELPDTTTVDDDSPTYTVVEEMPQFLGGVDALMEYLSSNIKYPDEAMKNGISGTCFISFIVKADGSVSEVKVLRGFNESCDNEAVRVVESMPNWIPGKENGKAVNVQYNIPIRFNLGSK